MKLFAMLMLRFEIVMLLYSLFQSVTLVTLHEVHKWEEWKKSCQEVINEISTAQVPISLDDLSGIRQIKTTFHNMYVKLCEFSNLSPKGIIPELLKRRLKKPLGIVSLNCNFLLNQDDEYKDNKYFLESLLSKIRSIAKEFEKEFNTFIFEVELELTKQATWTLGINHELGNKFNALWTSTEKKECYCDIDSFKQAWSLTNGNYEHLEPLIIDAKLSSLEKELHAKIAVFAQQPQPFFDWDGFFGFSTNFCFKWNDIKKNIEDLENLDEKNEVYRKKLDDLAKNALNETVPLKAIITQKLDKVVKKWQEEKSIINKILKVLPKKDKQKKIDGIISDFGIFNGNAYKLLEYFERDNNDDFSVDELKEAVEKDREEVLQAYQVDKFTAEDWQRKIDGCD